MQSMLQEVQERRHAREAQQQGWTKVHHPFHDEFLAFLLLFGLVRLAIIRHRVLWVGKAHPVRTIVARMGINFMPAREVKREVVEGPGGITVKSLTQNLLAWLNPRCKFDGCSNPDKSHRFYTLGDGTWAGGQDWGVPGAKIDPGQLAAKKGKSVSPRSEYYLPPGGANWGIELRFVGMVAGQIVTLNSASFEWGGPTP